MKILTDVSEGQIVQVKFYGEFKKDQKYVQIITCDLTGIVYLVKFSENVLGTTCNKQCFWKKKLNGPAFNIAPLFYDFDKHINQIQF